MSKKKETVNFEHYLFAFTDDVGIFQHSKYGIPDRNHGYTTDDNARALLLAVMLFEQKKNKKYMKLIYTYLAFVYDALNDKGMFKNFMNYQRDFMEEQGSEDCFGRCMWALGRTISSPNVPQNIKNTCIEIINRASENIEKIGSPRAKAYIIVGLSYISCSKKMVPYIETLALSLAQQYKQYKDSDWNWFENSVTYGNAFFPWSMLCAYRVLGEKQYLKIANESLTFLEEIVIKKNFYKPIGCNGWYVKGEKVADYDEQPIEACEMICFYKEYYELTKEKKSLINAQKCMDWYHGVNSKKVFLIDSETGACYDGITSKGLNLNQGSESIISYGMSVMSMKKGKRGNIKC